MKYDFTTVLDRSGKDSIAFDVPPKISGVEVVPCKEGLDRIPMWVADMGFQTVPSITEKISQRIEHPIFGYFEPTDEYYDSIIKWQKTRNGAMSLKASDIGYENSVLGGLMSALNVLCSKGDKVLVHSPTYVGFTGALKNSGYDIVHSALKLDENNVWRMDFADMEEKIVSQNIQTAIFCSPHNPCGRAWEHWEIAQAMEIFERYDVYVIADEIWSDIMLDGNRHIPTQSVSLDAKNRTVALYAPSKTFNLAGLIGAYHIIYNERLHNRVLKESSLSHYNGMNIFSMHALIGAYSEQGSEWVCELREVLTDNIDYACEFFDTKVKGIKVSKPQATYMLFIDCTEWLIENNMTLEQLIKKGFEYGVMWQNGEAFFGKNCIRLNFALPFAKAKEALDRMDKYIFNA
ncbi:MAG: aminotransferase class I/II-fold pyridoxal phosphate-dependent enzyme [Clostridia bacterium]